MQWQEPIDPTGWVPVGNKEGPGNPFAWSEIHVRAGLLAKIELGGQTALLNLLCHQGGKATTKPKKCRDIEVDGRTDSHPPHLEIEGIAALEGTKSSLVEGGRTDPPLGPT